MTKKNASKGFTLIEILIVIGIIAILAAIVIVAINPAKQFAQARNTQRESNINTILNAVGQRIADNKGVFAGTFDVGADTYTCPALPTGGADRITDDNPAAGDEVDLNCLFPTYIPASLPFDPEVGHWTSETNYDTGYEIEVDSNGRVTVCAPESGTEAAIPDNEEICVTR